MFKNKSADRTLNICGSNVAVLRKNAVQQIECGLRFVTDIELKVFAKVFGVTVDALLEEQNSG